MTDDGRPTVLVLRALQIGDLLVAVPALRALRRAYPGHRLVLATTAALAPLVDRIGGVDLLLPTPDPTAVPWSGPPPDVAVNLHGTGPQSHRALDALGPGRRIGFRCGAAGPGWEGPGWDAVAAARPHERERWCALLSAVGVPADARDLRLGAPGGASGSPQGGPAVTGWRQGHPAAAPAPGAGGPSAGEPGTEDSGTGGPGTGEQGTEDSGTGGPGTGEQGTEDSGATGPGPGPGRPSPILVHPGAAFGAKRWPVDRFAAVAAALDGPGSPVLVTGSAAERELADAVARGAGLPAERVVAGRTDLGQLCDLVGRAALVVSGDTGIAHLASAYGIPSVVLFGPVDPAQWGPPAGGPHVALAHPGGRRGERFADEPDPALLAITVEEVLAAVAAVRPTS